MFIRKYTSHLIFLALAVFGALITHHYGESWDELKFYKYANTAITSYTTWPQEGTIPIFGKTYDNYGPAYVMLVTLAARPLDIIFTTSDARHYVYFITFLAGMWAFYELSKRFLTHPAALFATLLFATQPLIWGHAFISPKDIPFLSFFLLSLLSGLRLFDSLKPLQSSDLSPRSKRILLALSALWLATVIGLFLTTDAFLALLTRLVQSAQAGETNIISFIASDIHKVEPEVYIQRYFLFFLWSRSFFFLLSSFLLLFFTYRLHRSSFILFISILPAAVLLGLSTNIRILGPFAALFIVYYAIRALGRQAIFPLAIYAIVAIFTMYITWPYLWLNPIGHFIESLRVMSQYPWPGRVLFNGVEYSSTDIPYSYLPVLLGMQMTEPVWVLFVLGSVAAGLRAREKRGLIALTMIWFIIPLIGFIVTRSPLYDNFRQVFFILPPVFMMAGVVMEKIKRPALQIAVTVLLIMPGIIDGLRLHPYEYIYYNRFAGGESGVIRKFEQDYWGTSYREAAEWINAHARNGASVWVDGPAHLLGIYLREDLQMYSSYEEDRAAHYDYIVSTSRYNLDLFSH
ncbi:MAG: hypothetical protein MUO77_16370, partial [Anaerolineales bacterium]|nr:hypothetical protein [Anaerolineales bacterium]